MTQCITNLLANAVKFVTEGEVAKIRIRSERVEGKVRVWTAVDAEVRSSMSTLQALASSRYLDSEDLPGFHDEAAPVLKTQPGWLTINLALASGQQVINLLRSPGAALGEGPRQQLF